MTLAGLMQPFPIEGMQQQHFRRILRLDLTRKL